MTLVQMMPSSAAAAPAARGAAADAGDTGGPRVPDDMTVEVALSVMASARVRQLPVCDDDGLCTALVTRARLTAVRDSSAYTDRIRLRDVRGDGEPPVAERRGSASGVLARAR